MDTKPIFIVRRPLSTLAGSAVLLFLPTVLLFFFGWRIAACGLFAFSALGFFKMPWKVSVTDAEICVLAPLRRVCYPLGRIKNVVFLGTTSPAVQIELMDGPDVMIKGFGIDGIDDLYKAALAAWQNAASQRQST